MGDERMAARSAKLGAPSPESQGAPNERDCSSLPAAHREAKPAENLRNDLAPGSDSSDRNASGRPLSLKY
jgi:hypothetical protein